MGVAGVMMANAGRGGAAATKAAWRGTNAATGGHATGLVGGLGAGVLATVALDERPMPMGEVAWAGSSPSVVDVAAPTLALASALTPRLPAGGRWATGAAAAAIVGTQLLQQPATEVSRNGGPRAE